MKIKILLILPFVFTLTNCASIVSKSNYPVTFTSSKPVTVEVKNKKTGELVHSGRTPTTAVLSASGGFFKPANYSVQTPKSESDLKATMDPWYAGNIVFGGIIGGIFVDPATGSMWKLPEQQEVPAE